ncbi:MAG: trypsin-like peptidase domain-containing protein [Nodosilinea sp.]
MNIYIAFGTTALSLSLGLPHPFAEATRPMPRVASAEVTLAEALESETAQPLTVVTNASDLGLDLTTAATFIPEGLTTSGNPAEGSRGVIGEDNRVLMTSQSFPWTAVGQIYGVKANGEAYTCTGALVAEDIVLTNAHCVLNPDTGEFSQKIAFLPNLINGRLVSDEDAAFAVDVLAGTSFVNQPNANADDWAFVKLDKPLGMKYGTLGMTSLSTAELAQAPFAENLVMVGYSGDFPAENPGQTASAHLGCSVLDEEDEMVLHVCDTYGGSSGGPILGEVDGEVRIVALNSAELKNRETGEGIVNLAVKIPRIVSQLNAMEN